MDLVSGDTMREIFSGEEPFDVRKVEQLNAHLKMLGKEGGVEVTYETDVGGKPRQVKTRVTKGMNVFLNPKGARANAELMRTALRENPNLECQIYNTKGEMKVISRGLGNIGDLSEPALSNWLGLP